MDSKQFVNIPSLLLHGLQLSVVLLPVQNLYTRQLELRLHFLEAVQLEVVKFGGTILLDLAIEAEIIRQNARLGIRKLPQPLRLAQPIFD